MPTSKQRPSPHPFRTGPAALAGRALGAAFGLVARIRRTRALHPVGQAGRGVLTVSPVGSPLGVPLLDAAGQVPCEVRWSRAMGRRRGLDIDGLALRLAGEGGGDLLFASAGGGRWSRFVLALRRPGGRGALTTVLPLRSAGGPVVLMVDPGARGGRGLPASLALSGAAPRGAWRRLGLIDVVWDEGDSTLRFDPHRPPAGLSFAPWWRLLRRPAYAASQRVPARPEPLLRPAR